MCTEGFAKTEAEITNIGAQDFLGKPLPQKVVWGESWSILPL